MWLTIRTTRCQAFQFLTTGEKNAYLITDKITLSIITNTAKCQ